jgi:beta-lactamase regulating signal transducer with metallopeptidase domain
MHAFKRFYLFFSIVVSLVAPLITISFNVTQQSFVFEYISKEPADFIEGQSTIAITENLDKTILLLIAIYLVGVAFGLFRFIKTVFVLIKRMGKETSILFYESRLVLLDENILPHSFLNTIFLNKETFLKGKIENEILVHELAHIKQYHSFDILIVQLIQCIFWFNPIYILYLRTIQLNHEFLADEAVLRSSGNPLSYQNLLLQKISGKSFALTSQFNYLIIKKRLVMITKTKHPQTQLVKKLIAISLFLITAFLFTTKEMMAQKVESTKSKNEVPSTKEGASAELVNEYEAILTKHQNTSDKRHSINLSLSKEEKERLYTIYTMMSKEQQEKQTIGFAAKPPLNSKKTLIEEQLQTWLDSKKYFVRIDGWKKDNGELKNYKASDFDYYDFYKPNKGSTDYGKYEAQINLVTKEAYARNAKAWSEQEPYLLVTFTRRKKSP